MWLCDGRKKNNITSSVYDCTVEGVEYIYNTLSPFAVEDVYTELVIDVFYIFNSTVIDWTCYIFFLCDRPIPRPEESYHVCVCVFVCLCVCVWERERERER